MATSCTASAICRSDGAASFVASRFVIGTRLERPPLWSSRACRRRLATALSPVALGNAVASLENRSTLETAWRRSSKASGLQKEPLR